MLTGVSFQSGGKLLVGRLWRAQGEGPKPTAVLLHGIPGIEQNHDLALTLRAHGWNSLIYHYRGCWGSGGAYSVLTIVEDVRAALDFLSLSAQVDKGRLVLVGHSLGGWAAVLAGAEDDRVKGIASLAGVLEPHQLQFEADDARENFVPYLNLKPAQFLQQWGVLSGWPSPLELAPKLMKRPLLLIHGSADQVVPLDHTKKMAAACENHPHLETHYLSGADHGFSQHRDALIGHITNWLGNYL